MLPWQLLGSTVDKQFENLKVNLTDQTLLKNDSKESLKKLNTSGVDDINFEKFTNEVSVITYRHVYIQY